MLAGFPLFLVITLHQPTWEFGLASALSYGGGAIFSWVGGRIGDRIGHKHLALIGNSLIPLLALSALVASPAWAIGFLCGGWWFRNLRSPSRRVMLAEAVPNEKHRGSAFGFLHAIDVGGGALAGLWVIGALTIHLAFRWIFLIAGIPLVISTLFLSKATTGGKRKATEASSEHKQVESDPPKGVRPLLIAASLYGFTAYSVGFPVLTVAKGSGKLVYGIAAFLILQLVSSITGYLLGGRLGSDIATQFRWLGLLGYFGAAIGAGLLALGGSGNRGGSPWLFVGVAVIGFGLGIVETLEPAAMSVLRSGLRAGRGFAGLSAARSVGTFVGNLMMGLLYGIGASAAYSYAGVVAGAAGIIVLIAVPGIRSWQEATQE